ncbi:MAG: quinone-dependent dihydroorotate dehydrogenase [bacterium]
MLYELIKPFLFRLDPEKAHNFTLQSLRYFSKLGISPHFEQAAEKQPKTVMGISFPNPVGLAAGLDKNGDYIDALAVLGFGFLEIGTVTPRPQPGNPKPRLFRLPSAEAIINRMGFNNKGIDYFVKNVRRSKFRGVLGINVGKNFDTPNESAVDDYLICLRKAYPYASYIAVNISSPNTEGLRDLQQENELNTLLNALKEQQLKLSSEHHKYVPLAVKIAPDLDTNQIAAIASALLKHEIDGVIATNTTISRTGVENLRHGNEIGGLSGTPLREQSTMIIKKLKDALGGQIPIIGVGGICSAKDAQKKFEAGASLVQIYTGLIYRGPGVISEIANSRIFA